MDRKIFAATSVSVAAAATSGRYASRTRSMAWYDELRKPAYVPPRGVFVIAWTALYADIGATAAAAIDRMLAQGRNRRVSGFVAALSVNLVLNAGWSWLFFKHHKLGASALGAAMLTASSADLAHRVALADTRAGLTILPYPGWCGFATVMSTHIWRLNRSRDTTRRADADVTVPGLQVVENPSIPLSVRRHPPRRVGTDG